MSKGYRVVEPKQLSPFLKDEKYHEYAIAIFYWLIEKLYSELKDELADVEIEVIPVVRFGAYPALGLHYEPMIRNEHHLEMLVKETAERLLQEVSLNEIIKFIGATGLDWKAITADIMNEVSKESLDLYYDGIEALEGGELELAYKLLLESVNLDAHFKTHERLYTVLNMMGRKEEAAHHIQQAYAMNPNNSKTATLYAESLSAQGKRNEAVLLLFKILRHNTTYKPAERLLERLNNENPADKA
jgi:tetratricopeptide (TPR) repeat protein